jgi:cytochrome b561
MSESKLPAWDIDYDLSSISFTGEQAGAKFTGTWAQWQGDIRFDPDDLPSSTARVVISTGFPDTNDAERDATMQNEDWFDVANHPSATFTVNSFSSSSTASGYVADGFLSVKGRRSPVQFTFTVELDNERATLIGNALIDRLEQNVGTGEWLDTSWVGQFIDVDVRVVARLPHST